MIIRKRNRNINNVKSGKEIIITLAVFPILFLWSLTLLYPFIWTFINSFKTPGEFFMNSFSFPEKIQFSNWSNAITTLKVAKSNPLYSSGMIEMIFNSLWWMFGSVIINNTVTVMMAYALAKYNFRIGKFLHAFSLVIMTVSIVGAFPAQYSLFHKINIMNSPAMLVTAAGCIGGSALLIYYSYFRNISWTYAEATFIDGGGHWTVFLKVMLPQALPIISAMTVIGCIGIWNDYFTALIYLPDFPTLATGLYLMSVTSLTVNNKPLYFAAVLISALPIFIIFMIFQKKIMTSVSMGGLKG